jgi:F-type H+-transporting ATPase subunit b
MNSLWKAARRALVATTATLLPVLVLVAESAEAAEADAGNPWVGLLWKFVNFAILAGALFYFLRKPISQALVDRHEGVKQALAEAREAKAAAEAKYREYTAKVTNLEEEVRAIEEEFRAEAERQKLKVIRDAEASAEYIRRQAETAGANEVKRVTDELRAEFSDLALRIAQELVEKAYTAEDQKKAVDDTIAKIERVH